LKGTSPQVRALSAFLTLSGPFPPGTCRPVFVPVPPLGFHPSGSISTRRAVRPLGRRCPPGVGQSDARRIDCLGCVRFRRTLGVRDRAPASLKTGPSSGLCSLRASVSPGELIKPAGDRDPRGFLLLRGFSLSVGDPSSESILSRASVSDAQAKSECAPQSIRPAKRSAGLPRASLPFRGLPPRRRSQLCAVRVPLGYPSKTACCCQRAASSLRFALPAAIGSLGSPFR